jgi:hypothetical protein
MESFGKTYICIDALDDFTVVEAKNLIQKVLGPLVEKVPAVRILFTSRISMKTLCCGILESAIPLPTQASKEDITTYINHKITKETAFAKRDDSENLRKRIVAQLVAESYGILVTAILAMH